MHYDAAEKLIPIRQLPRHIPGRPHLSTIFRWLSRGVRGIRLASVRVGGRRFVSPAQIENFIAAVTSAGAESSPSRDTARVAEIDRADRSLQILLDSARQKKSHGPAINPSGERT